jgi:hypothetical protein
MKWEYRKLGVSIGGTWDSADRPADGISELNRLAREGWQVERVIPLSRRHGRADSIVFLLRREASVRQNAPAVPTQRHIASAG